MGLGVPDRLPRTTDLRPQRLRLGRPGGVIGTQGESFFLHQDCVRNLIEITKSLFDVQAYARELAKTFDHYAQVNKKIPKEVLNSVVAIDEPSRMVDLVSSHIHLKTEEKQEILEIV